MTVRGLLFDKDGTLLDFQATWTPVIRQAAAIASNHDMALGRVLMMMGGFDPDTEETRAGSVLAAGTTIELAELWAPHVPGAEVEPLTEALERVFQEGAMVHAMPVCPLEGLQNRSRRTRPIGPPVSTSLDNCRLTRPLTRSRSSVSTGISTSSADMTPAMASSRTRA